MTLHKVISEWSDENGRKIGAHVLRNAADTWSMGHPSAATLGEYALARRADYDRQRTALISAMGVERASQGGIRAVDRGHATDAPGRVAPIGPGHRDVAPFGGSQRFFDRVSGLTEDKVSTEDYRWGFRVWSESVRAELPITKSALAELWNVPDALAGRQIAEWVSALDRRERGETYSPMLGSRDAGGSASDVEWAAWSLLSRFVGTDRWAATLISTVRRVAEQRGRRPDYSIGEECGQSAILSAAETIIGFLTDTDSLAVPVTIDDMRMMIRTDDIPSVTRRQMIRTLERFDSEGLPILGDGTVGWVVPREIRCGECEGCEDADSRGDSRWMSLRSCQARTESFDVQTPGAILHRRLASHIATAMRSDVRQGIVRTGDREWLMDAAARSQADSVDTTTGDVILRDPLAHVPDEVASKVRQILAACRITGENPFAPRAGSNGARGLSEAASQFLAVAFGRPITEKGIRLAQEDLVTLAARTGVAGAAPRAERIGEARARSAMAKRAARRQAKR